MENWLKQAFLENTLDRYFYFFGIVILVILFKRYISHFIGILIYRIFRRYSGENEFQKFRALIQRPLQWLLVFIVINFSFSLLKYPSLLKVKVFDTDLQWLLQHVMLALIAVAFTWLILRVIDFIAYLQKKRGRHTSKRLDDQLIPFLKDLMKIFITLISIFFILREVFQFNIASLITGLGIGGIALALAAQDTLKNLFSSFTIFLDQPFSVGDLIKVDTISGTIIKVGFRSTRIRTADKTFVTVPNSMMTDRAVDNLTLRTHRRLNFTIGLSYETKSEQLKSIVSDIQKYLNARLGTDQDHFAKFDNYGESSLNMVIEYYVPKGEYMDFLQVKEEVNLKIMEIVQQHSAHFAQTTKMIQFITPETE